MKALTRAPRRYKVGSIHKSVSCGDFEIVSHNGASEIKIKFLNTGSERVVHGSSLSKGLVKDLFRPRLNNIGFIGDGDYNTDDHKYHYVKWSKMLNRCYGEEFKKTDPSYAGCTVCEEWHSFQNFATWLDRQPLKKGDLDKDLLVSGNRIYSPEACMVIPKRINRIACNKAIDGSAKNIGALYNNGFYSVILSINSNPIYIGNYASESYASDVYRMAKYKYITKVAMTDNHADKRLKGALINVANSIFSFVESEISPKDINKIDNIINKHYSLRGAINDML